NHNVITGNLIHNNSGNGVVSRNSKGNTISGNNVYSNGEHGIRLDYLSDFNTVENNNFTGNNAGYRQAIDDGSNNVFIFNYWSDLTSTDIDGDGIVDNRYSIPGSASNQDPYPVTILGAHVLGPLAVKCSRVLFSATVLIQWKATADSFDHSITYSVYSSTDNGKTWIALATDLKTTEYRLDTSTIPAGITCLIKVVTECSEGLIAENIIDNTFTRPDDTSFVLLLAIMAVFPEIFIARILSSPDRRKSYRTRLSSLASKLGPEINLKEYDEVKTELEMDGDEIDG
ncbi:MAG: NosD domain-containing protein, partial [Candidatus Odinarchaeota archaeon]